MPSTPKMVMILSENDVLVRGDDLTELVRWAQVAEDAGFDAVMISEHVVLGPDSAARGIMSNPRAYAAPGNQDPRTPWPNSMLLLGAISSVTTELRLVASAILAPLRHPLLLARELGTLDLLSRGRLVVQPSVSWSQDEYAALGVNFSRRGKMLDEQLEVLHRVWTETPLSYHGSFYDFTDVYLEPKAHRREGPRMWFGGQQVRGAVLRRLVQYGHGWHPFGSPTADDMAMVTDALRAAGRDPSEVEMVGGTRATFANDHAPADLGEAMAPIREQWDAGYTTFCIKPSQYLRDPAELDSFATEVIRRAEQIVQ